MAKNVKNIIIGAAAVYLSELDSTQSTWFNVDGSLGPSLPTGSAGVSLIGALNGSADFEEVGFTSEGVEVSYEPDYGDVEVDQLLDSAKLFKQSMRVMVNTTFAEATLENLMIVWGQQTASYTAGAAETGTADTTLKIESGALGDEPVERSVVFVGPAPRSAAGIKRERVYHVRRALSVESTAHALRRNEPTALPVSFRALPDPSQSGAEYGIVRDRNIAT
jgi:hypothetical protein